MDCENSDCPKECDRCDKECKEFIANTAPNLKPAYYKSCFESCYGNRGNDCFYPQKIEECKGEGGSRCKPDILTRPGWIDWNCVDYPLGGGGCRKSYRKITNLNGGDDNDLKWLSEFNTQQIKSEKSEPIIGPIYEKNPKYLWFLDTKNKKLKVSSAKNNKTYSLDPEQNCSGNSCCSNSSTENECLYKWHNGEHDCGCSSKHTPYFKKESNVPDEWNYYTTGDPNLQGTFCDKTEYSELGLGSCHMKAFLGCDCKNALCMNMSFDKCSEPSSYGSKNEWKFIDEAAAVACCTLSKEEFYDPEGKPRYPQCVGAFNPNSDANKCPTLMMDFCEGNWGNSNNIGRTCQSFLANSPAGPETIQRTIQNYITNDRRIPQDYVSKELYENGTPTSVEYYENKNCKKNGGKLECDRNDSEGFFKDTLPYLCNLGYRKDINTQNNLKEVCDVQLNYFCAQFDRDDLAADNTLQEMCGCHLVSSVNDGKTSPNIVGSKPMKLKGKPQKVSPYYKNIAGGDKCDVLCSTTSVKSGVMGGECLAPSCILDNVTISLDGSIVGGDVHLYQKCNGGNCYISETEIRDKNSQIKGEKRIASDCGSCWTFKDDISKAQQVDCDTLEPVNNDENEKSKTNYTTYIIVGIIVLAIIIIVGFMIYFYMKKKRSGMI